MLKNKIAKLLIDLKCVVLRPSNPFTYASGLKGPIYCDNRKIISHPAARSMVVDAFVNIIKERNLSYDQIAGLATGGIPYAALIADRLNKPMVYIRSKPKSYGTQGQVEGDYSAGEKIVLIEDLVNQGKSLGQAIVGATNAELEIEYCLSIVTYQMATADSIIKKHGVKLISLTDFETISQVSLELGNISSSEYEMLLNWQKNPATWQA